MLNPKQRPLLSTPGEPKLLDLAQPCRNTWTDWGTVLNATRNESRQLFERFIACPSHHEIIHSWPANGDWHKTNSSIFSICTCSCVCSPDHPSSIAQWVFSVQPIRITISNFRVDPGGKRNDTYRPTVPTRPKLFNRQVFTFAQENGLMVVGDMVEK